MIGRQLPSDRVRVEGGREGFRMRARKAVPSTTREGVDHELSQAIVDAMLDAQLVIDSKGRIVQANPAAREMFGYADAELLGRNIKDLMPEPWSSQHDGYIQRYLDEQRPTIMGTRRRDLYALRKSGESFPIELLVTGFERDGRRYFSGCVRDLSEFASTMSQIRRLTAAIDQAADPILILDAEYRVLYANAAVFETYGYTKSGVIGRTLREVNWGRSDASVYDDLYAHMEQLKPWSGHIRTARRDGRVIDEEVTVSPVLDQRESTYYVQVRRDITDRLAMERQLRQSQKLESIGQLAAGIAHEINTPAQYVSDNMQYLKSAFSGLQPLLDTLSSLIDSEEDIVSIEVLRNASVAADVRYVAEQFPLAIDQSISGMERVTNIVRAMKEFSHQGSQAKPANINQAIRSTVTLSTNEWKYVADVNLELEESLPEIQCVVSELNQVFLNIIVNAAHAIEEANKGPCLGKGMITIRTKTECGNLVIEIEDTGAGISESVRSKVFDPFFTTKDVGKGTGQGLSIAYRVVAEKHGGSIDVDSQVGRGTCFRIRLPLMSESCHSARPDSPLRARQLRTDSLRTHDDVSE